VQLERAVARFSGTTDGPLARPTATPARAAVRPSVVLTASTTFLPPEPASWAWAPAPSTLHIASVAQTRRNAGRRARRAFTFRRAGRRVLVVGLGEGGGALLSVSAGDGCCSSLGVGAGDPG
jgi:hypothetical protein